MKHVFLVHSHTTFLVSIGVIQYLGIDSDDVVLLLGRHYKNSVFNISFKTVDISDRLLYNRSILYNLHKRYLFIRLLDEIIHNEIKSVYLLYVPHLVSYGIQVLATNKKCRGINLCQESARTFFEPNWSCKYFAKCVLLSGNKRIWAQNDWNLPEWVYHMKYGVRTFSFTENYFSPLSRADNHVINIPTVKFDVSNLMDIRRPFFIFDAAAEQGNIELPIYMEGCEYLIDKYAEENNYVKFHPSQNNENREQIISLFTRKGKRVEVFPDSIPFELLLMRYQGLKVYGFNSSLMYFAQSLGHIAISELDILVKKSRKYRKYIALK